MKRFYKTNLFSIPFTIFANSFRFNPFDGFHYSGNLACRFSICLFFTEKFKCYFAIRDTAIKDKRAFKNRCLRLETRKRQKLCRKSKRFQWFIYFYEIESFELLTINACVRLCGSVTRTTITTIWVCSFWRLTIEQLKINIPRNENLKEKKISWIYFIYELWTLSHSNGRVSSHLISSPFIYSHFISIHFFLSSS